MIKIADSDNHICNNELNIIKEILIDFFKISKKKSSKYIERAKEKTNNSVDYFKFSKYLESQFSYQDKLDLLKCIFEVGYSDGKLDSIEYHYIKIISNLFNIEHRDMIKSKIEMKKFF
tara:strand:+ start:3128 stop:3481 length:354 start_codon:yes stop_codon:yes gene_type:complete